MKTKSKLVQRGLPCPNPACGSSDAYSIWDDGHGYCFSCKQTNQPGKSQPNELNNDVQYTYEFLPQRGLSKETMQKYNIKTRILDGVPVAVEFDYTEGRKKIRSLIEKEFYSVGEMSSAPLFGMDKFSAGSAQSITLTEGEFDAPSLYEVLGSKYPVVSVLSSTSAKRDVTRARDYVNSFDKIYICFDNDPKGREATEAVAALFDPKKVYHVKLSKRKDANEYLQAGEAEDLKRIWWNARKYVPEGVHYGLSDFLEIVKKRPEKGVAYPWPTLTQKTYGLRTGESVLITAYEGVGKTELMHVIERNLLKETNDAVGAIFLEEPQHRHLQALAGLELGLPIHLPDTVASVDEISAALARVVQTDERLFLYSHFGSDDPEHILDTIRYLVVGCGVRWILLDHISMVVSGLAGEDERKALDYIATRLEMMVKELDFGLIFVSHVNDDGKTRGSRYISKVADIWIEAYRDVTAEDPVERNTIQLTLRKNRPASHTGPAGRLLFDLPTYSMKEEVINADLPA